MADSDKPDKHTYIDELSPLGRALYAGGTAARWVAKGLDAVLDRAADLYVEAEKAFKDGVDPNVEDVRVIEDRSRAPEETDGSANPSPGNAGPAGPPDPTEPTARTEGGDRQGTV